MCSCEIFIMFLISNISNHVDLSYKLRNKKPNHARTPFIERERDRGKAQAPQCLEKGLHYMTSTQRKEGMKIPKYCGVSPYSFRQKREVGENIHI